MPLIKEYDEKYNRAINEFIISIYVEEFGFEEHRKEIEQQDNGIYVRNGGNILMAIDENDEIIGTIALVKHSKKNMEIKKLYVREDYRGKGISKMLYEQAISICKVKNIKRIFLGTYNKLETAIYFYINRRI